VVLPLLLSDVVVAVVVETGADHLHDVALPLEVSEGLLLAEGHHQEDQDPQGEGLILGQGQGLLGLGLAVLLRDVDLLVLADPDHQANKSAK